MQIITIPLQRGYVPSHLLAGVKYWYLWMIIFFLEAEISTREVSFSLCSDKISWVGESKWS